MYYENDVLGGIVYFLVICITTIVLCYIFRKDIFRNRMNRNDWNRTNRRY